MRLCSLLFCLALSTPAFAQESEARSGPSAEVDALFARWARADSPGAAVLVVRDGKVVHRRGYGMADLEQSVPIRPDTVFDIASVSKQFCGLAIASLVDQDKLDLETDVREYVSWVPDFGEKKVIRLRHLVHHTSGLRDWPGALRLAGWRFDDVISFEQILNMLRHQRDLNFVPGDRYSYSNTGYNLLAHIVEKRTGVSFATWTKGQVFDPLGMADTHFQDDHTRVIPRRATAYRKTKAGWHRIADELTAVGSSSLYTTIDDLAKWIGNFETGKVGGKSALSLMHTRGKLNSGAAIDYCFGVSHGTHRGLATVFHSGSWAGFKTVLMRFPEQRFSVVVLANTATIVPTRKAYAIAGIFLASVLAPEELGSGGAFAGRSSAWKPADLALYQGTYRSPELDTRYRVVAHEGHLELSHFRNETVRLTPAGAADRFRGNAWWVGSVQFSRDAAKKQITGFAVSNGRCLNVRFVRVAE